MKATGKMTSVTAPKRASATPVLFVQIPTISAYDRSVLLPHMEEDRNMC
jgi:hypothetical protein